MKKNLFFFLPFVVLACKVPHTRAKASSASKQIVTNPLQQESNTPIKGKKTSPMLQGIKGFVGIAVGNMMPMKGEPTPQPQPFATQIAVFPVLNRQDIAHHKSIDGLYTVALSPIATTYANAKGVFELALPVGSYSVLAKKDGYWYGNAFNEMHQLQVVTIVARQTTTVQIVISTDAVY
jgi:hypothetical protein